MLAKEPAFPPSLHARCCCMGEAGGAAYRCAAVVLAEGCGPSHIWCVTIRPERRSPCHLLPIDTCCRVGEAGRHTALQMDEEEAMAVSAARSKAFLNELYDTGAGILSGLSASRDRLKASNPLPAARPHVP